MALLLVAVPFIVFVGLLVHWAGRGDWILVSIPLGLFVCAGVLAGVSWAVLRRRNRCGLRVIGTETAHRVAAESLVSTV